MVMGLFGLGNCWRTAAKLWRFSPVVSEVILAIALVLWVIFLAIYIYKWCRYRDAAVSEWHHPIQGFFFPVLPISTLLMALTIAPYSHLIAQMLFGLGAGVQVSFSLCRADLWPIGRRWKTRLTPISYFPLVGSNLVSSIVAGTLGYRGLASLFLGVGLIAWLRFEPVIWQRLFAGWQELPKALRPSLGIQLAPPALSGLAYLNLTEAPPGLIPWLLLGYGLFQGGIILWHVPWIREQSFAPSYWALTFSSAALALLAMRFVERGVAIGGIAAVLFVGANLVIGSIAIGTVNLWRRNQLFPS
jgi:tellurite resistance protein